MEASASIGWLAPPTWLSLVILAVTFIIIYTYWVYDNRRKLNLPGPTPLPVFGNTLEVISKGLIGFDAAMVQKYGKLVAINGSGRIGDILVADLDILKEIMVRRASSFTDRNEDPAPMFEPFNQSLTFSKGEHWKQMRSTITPAFSSGKLKQMEALILACADRLVQNLKKKAQGDEDIDIKRMFDPYTMDVIASTSFGLQLDAQGNPNHPFIKNAKELMEPSLHSPVILILLFFPYLMKFLKPVFVFFNVAFVRTINFFVNILDQLEKERAVNPSEKNYADLVQLLLNSHNMSIQKSELSEDEQEVGKWKKKALTRAEMAANEILFLVAGYDTTSLTLTFASYFLATHPHVQDKLRSEIDEQLQGRDPTYESVKNLGYLEQVILETLRLYPPGVRVDRVATEDVVVRGLKIPKGTTCVIPIKTIHRHPDYWPEPDKFDPDRFTPDAIAKRHQFAFLGFGMGPRNCIGMRLAKLEIKIALVKILQRFTIKTCDETPTEITTRKDKPNRPGKPIILKVKERSF